MLTQEYLKRIWHYDPETGLFTRLVKNSNNCEVGDIAKANDRGYVRISIDGINYSAHRLAFLYMAGSMPSLDVDHIDGIKDNNRWCNLRDVTQLKNNQNRIKLGGNNKSGYGGVSWHKPLAKWRAQISVNNKKIHLGYFDDAHEAGAYFLEKKRELHEGCTI